MEGFIYLLSQNVAHFYLSPFLDLLHRNETEEDFIRRYMNNYLDDKGVYIYRKRNKTDVQFFCERYMRGYTRCVVAITR